MDDEAPLTAPPTVAPTQASGVVTLTTDQLQSLIQQAVATAAKQSDTVTEPEDEESDDLNGTPCLDEEVPTSPPVSDALADSIKLRLKQPMTQELMAVKREKYKEIPSNMVQVLRRTGINPELYSAIPVYARNNDKR